MKKILSIVLVIFIFLCSSCNLDYYESGEVNYGVVAADVIDRKNDEYLEEPDSVEGLTEDDLKDLSSLKAAFDNIGLNYTSKTKVYFNEDAVLQVNKTYEMDFYCQQTSIINEKYFFKYSENLKINSVRMTYNNHLYLTSLTGSTKEEMLTKEIPFGDLSLVKQNYSWENDYFTLNDLNSAYVDKYGPTTVIYGNSSIDYLGWTRIGQYKYKCDRLEVLADFVKLCSPDYTNGGTYMTYRYVTVELDPTTLQISRLRLYASPTQSGKMLEEHLDKQNKPLWYLLFAEAYISDINTSKVDSLEQIYLNQDLDNNEAE